MDDLMMLQSMAGGGGGPPRKPPTGIKSWYYDPLKWGIIKSVGLFALGVMIAREMKGFDVASGIQGAAHPPPVIRALIPVTILQLTEEEVGVDIEDLRKWRRKPNIVFLLTDDQAAVDDSMYKMPTVRDHLLKSGVRFSHAFASTPICCPSRSSILTGLYQHNHRVFNNSLEGGCSSRDWQLNHEANALPVLMKKAGYNTFYAGKYLNQYGDRSVGGESHVPAGWDQWFGLLGNSRYYNYSLSANGVREQHGDQPEDYLTTVIGKKALSFLDEKPWSSRLFSLGAGKKYQNSGGRGVLDDLLRDVMTKLKRLSSEKGNLMQDTIFLVTSDHGFHLGEFSLPWDKRQPYEFDIRIPM
ncbi:unnamed protein product, partial [Cyprideis torosa]